MKTPITPISFNSANLFSKEACLLFVLPFLLLLLNSGLFISNAFHSKTDPWIYYGYFLNLPQHLELFTYGHAYFGDRLAFLIPGYLCNQVFAPVPADYILHFGYYYTAVFSLYLLLKMTFDKRTALFTTLLFGGYYYNLWMFSWNHVDGAVNAYFLLTLFFFTRAASGRKRILSSFLAGTFFTIMVYTSIHALKLAPGMAVFVMALLFMNFRNESLTGGSILQIAGYSLLGVICSNFVFSAVNYLLTGDAFVLRQTFEFTRWLFNEYQNPPEITMHDVSRAYWLILPALVAVASLFTILRHLTRKILIPNRFVILFAVCFIFLLLPFFLANLKSSQPAILVMASCQFSYLNGGLFLALGALSSAPLERLSLNRFRLVTLAILFVFIAPLAMVESPGWREAKGPSLVGKVMATIQKVDPEGSVHFMFKAPHKDLANLCGNPNFTIPGRQTDLTELYHNIGATFLWDQANRVISHNLPEITNPFPFKYLKRGDKILVLTIDDKEVDLAQAALAQRGTATQTVAVEMIREKDISFYMVFLEIQSTGSALN